LFHISALVVLRLEERGRPKGGGDPQWALTTIVDDGEKIGTRGRVKFIENLIGSNGHRLNEEGDLYRYWF
jgi:hypothetical protein